MPIYKVRETMTIEYERIIEAGNEDEALDKCEDNNSNLDWNNYRFVESSFDVIK